MRRWFCFIFMSLNALLLHAQKLQQQEQRVLLTYNFEPTTNLLEARYEEVLTKADSNWQVLRYTYPDKQLVADYGIIEPTSRFKHGIALSFYPNGQLRDSGYYVEGYKEEWHFGWFENGALKSKFRYYHGMPADTCITWYASGDIESVRVLDMKGSGYQRDMYPNQQLKAFGGIGRGIKYGRWRFFDEANRPIMEVRFEYDSAMQTTCFDTAGNKMQGACVFHKGPEFPGGVNGWNNFLSNEAIWPSNLNLPYNNVLVVISFLIDTQGSVSNFEVLQSAHPLLTKEAFRILNMTNGKWKPAVYLNQPVDFRFIAELHFKQKISPKK